MQSRRFTSRRALHSLTLLSTMLLVVGFIWFAGFDGDTFILPADAALPDGSRYYGATHENKFHGDGKLLWPNGGRYQGTFEKGLFHGNGVLQFADGGRYQGEFQQGQMSGEGSLYSTDESEYHGEFSQNMMHGQGTIIHADGSEYTGTFIQGQIRQGRFSDSQGNIYQGEFDNWQFHGEGEYIDSAGNRYRGSFQYGDLNGDGTVILVDGSTYRGELKNWTYSGEGSFTDSAGNQYTGEFAYGQFHGHGQMHYATPVDGVEEITGEWEYGLPVETPVPHAARVRREAIETAVYSQNKLLDHAHNQLLKETPNIIDMYFLGVAGDRQDVFLKEIQFVRNLFDNSFTTRQRSLALMNSYQTLDSAPLATKASLDRTLDALAAKMNTEEDILFLYMTSHGSADHRFSINLPGIDFPSISAEALSQSLRDSAIRWKIVVISACYSGGFIPLLENDDTLVITAARADRQSFGCGEDSDMTYFGRAFFEQALPEASSFEDAFQTASDLIEKREDQENPNDQHSEPQIAAGEDISAHLQTWWSQVQNGQKVAQGLHSP